MLKKTKVVKKFCYKGFEVQIINNCQYDFRYEYQLKALTKQNKYILKKEIKSIRKFQNKIFDLVYDPTSHKNKETAIYFGKVNINELRYRMSCSRLKYI